GTNVAPHVQPTGDPNIHTDAERHVQPAFGGNPIALPPFPPNLVRTHAAPHSRSDVMQHIPPEGNMYIGTNVAPHVQPAGDPNIHTDAERHVQPAFGGNPIALPPFPPNLVRTHAAPHSRSDVMQHIPPEGNMYIGTNVAPHVQPAGDPNIHTDAERHVQPAFGGNPVALPPFPPNLVRTHAAPHSRSDVMQHIPPEGNMYIGTNVAPHVQPAGDPNIRTDAGRHVQPVLGVNANALPPFPPDLHPPPMARVGTHVNQQGRGNVFGDIRNPDAAQVQHGARTYAPGRSEPQPPGYPQLRSHDH
ncbi:hypothetical protein OH76DRAFT_1531224, partial [Lentinus brumalis]